MQPIIKAQKSRMNRDLGIDVVYMKGDKTGESYFSFSELIDMRINTLDLLDNPEMYLFDMEQHRIQMSPEKSAKQ